MVPAYRHADPPPIPDGQAVIRPRPPLPLATRQFVYGAICAVVVLALLVVGIARQVLS